METLIPPTGGQGVASRARDFRALRRLGLRLQYDGTGFHGWQRQLGTRTVQGTLEDVVRGSFDPEATVDGASRTDAGVHARDQLAALTLRHPIAPAGLVKALNARLPADVAVQVAWEAAADFMPRFAAHGKTYTYRLYTAGAPQPLIDRQAWRIGWVLNGPAMEAAAAPLVGTHDFTSFAASDHGQTTAVRTIHSVRIERPSLNAWWITVEGSAFLKQMVRNLVGTLVDVGRGQRPTDCLPGILAARNRRCAGPTAPARGLTLERVWYEPEAPEPARS